MKVLFTNCIFNCNKINQLENIVIELINERIDYNEDELCKWLKKFNCYIFITAQKKEKK